MERGIEWSRNWLTKRTKWRIREDTFQVLDESRTMWIADVDTTHLGVEGEAHFTILVQDTNHVILEDNNLSVLAEWIQKRKTSTNDA